VPTLLSDPPDSLYLVLIALAVVTGAVAARKQTRKSLIVFGVAAVLLLVVFLIDYTVESPREGAVAGVKAIEKGANARDPEAFVAPVADTLEYKGAGPAQTFTKAQFRSAAFWQFLSANRTISVNTKGFDRADVVEIDPNTVEIGFVGQGSDGTTTLPFYFRATFTRQPDGKMRMTKLASFDFASRTAKPVSIPNFP
jgi:hypothetical protein